MNTLLVKLLILGNSLLLALPAGICCADLSGRSESAPAAQTTCCRHPQSSQPHQPARPAAECCCDRDATLPTASAVPAALQGISHQVADTAIVFKRALDDLQDESLLQRGPPLRVLQCVWRC